MLSHHAPTRRLLENFQRIDGGPRPSLWVYSKSIRARQVFNLRKVGSEGRYFGNDPDGRTEEEIEQMLNRNFESDFHALLPTFLSPLCCIVTDEMRIAAAAYVGNLFLRSKPLRIGSERFTERTHARALEILEDPAVLTAHAEQVSKRMGKHVPDFVAKELAKRTFTNTKNMSDRAFFLRSTKEFSRLPKALAGLNWTICRTEGPQFIQSDAAVALLNRSPLRDGSTIYGFGLERMGTAWYMPLSPWVCLRVSPRRDPTWRLDSTLVGEINEFLIRAAVNSVYSSSFDPQVNDAVSTYLGDLHYFEHLIESDVETAARDLLYLPHLK